MIPIFTHNFFSLIAPPNKEELIKFVEEQQYVWKRTEGYGVESEILNADNFYDILSPSIDLFFEEYPIRQSASNSQIIISHLWRNIYHKGTSQVPHDHLGQGDITAVLFMSDQQHDFGEFYFMDGFNAILPDGWRKLVDCPKGYTPKTERGSIIFFPSHMLHGVTIHKSDICRKSMSFTLTCAS